MKNKIIFSKCAVTEKPNGKYVDVNTFISLKIQAKILF